MRRADLHAHTIYSDSTLTPEQFVEQALENNLFAAAVTDHDTIDGVDPVRRAAQGLDLEIIPGIEMSSQYQKKTVHILGYFYNSSSENFLKYLDHLKTKRHERMLEMIDRLAKRCGIHGIDYNEVSELTESYSVGRPHLAQVLVEKGFAYDFKDAFDRYLSDKGKAYVPNAFDDPYKVIEVLSDAGAVPVLAHPMVTKVDELIPSFVEAGLKGVEGFYPGTLQKMTEFYQKIAKKHGLVVTGGSDAHGGNRSWSHLGKAYIEEPIVEQLKALAGGNRK